MGESRKEVWLLPIRYWETQEPIRCDFIRDTREPADAPEAGTVYVFHHGFGHEVYVHAADLRPSREEAIAEAQRRKEAKAKHEKANFERLWESTLLPLIQQAARKGKQMTDAERKKWLANLKTGDEVAVVDAPAGSPSGRVIHTSTVTRGPTGRLYLGTDRRRDWSSGYRRDPGAGPRALMPAKKENPDGE